MGSKNSNPVLQVLQNNLHIKQEVKYPPDFLQFNGSGWRAFYHCHSNPSDIQPLFKAEHGHFHIFAPVVTQPDAWSHLVALSMADVGQPLCWFMVNHWVSGEKWLATDLLEQQIKNIPFSKQNNMLEQWLLSILVVCQVEIISLLHQRDSIIKSKPDEKCKQDRSLYLLAEKKIKLPYINFK
ncbi:hypothetical protein MNBD_GAMMA23-740 [hydrothermal vent metagenome]|uniref:DUF6969 domain-containing protein n=1 Tax=hydrothermal vent metagenome TaxID=652676 RepID=A0A3B0ZK21_9ZZZZ